MSDQSDAGTPLNNNNKSPKKPDINDRQIELLEENKNLRRKLKLLSARLDDELQKAAKQKLKAGISYVSTVTPESQSLQLQNAYKMIERLQKTVKDFQSKESYQISFKRILDLQSIMKKKQTEIQELRQQIKDLKKTIREKEKHVNDLLDRQAVNPNLNEQKEQIQKLRQNLRKVLTENQQLKKRELQKHKKLVTAERRLVQYEQEDEQPIGKQQQLLNRVQQLKAKYKDAMVRIQKQNSYITKLHTKISALEDPSAQRRHRTSREPKQVSRSMEQLPDLSNPKVKPNPLEHIPSPNVPYKMLRRY